MYRWPALIAIFIFIFIASLWTYIFLYRVELTKLGISNVFENELIAIEDMRISKNSLVLHNVAIVKKENPNLRFIASQIEAKFSLLSICFWAFNPVQRPMPLISVSIDVQRASLPIDRNTKQAGMMRFQIDKLLIFKENIEYKREQIKHLSIHEIVEIASFIPIECTK
ncbi:MAG: hypothetical protein QRY74_06020 [Chlamydia sp.]